MKDIFIFYPPRQAGLLIQSGALMILSAMGIWSLWQAASAQIGPLFLLYLLLTLLVIIVLPMVAYRVYALQTASYTLERDGIRLRWGFRVEVIPMDQVEWVHSASELSVPVPLPWLRWQGAVTGVRRLPDGSEVEFMAATSRRLVFVATPERLFGISPEDPLSFIKAYQRFTEMGSLAPLSAHAQHPTFLFAQVWRTPAARVLIIAGFTLCLILLGWVSFVIPGREQVHLGFNSDGSPGALVPAAQLLLLPVLCALFYVMDFFTGLFFFRREDAKPLSYLLWGSGTLMPLLAMIALFLILRVS